MSSYAGKWGYSRDEETYFGKHDSADEAAREGASEEGETIFVGQYRDPVQPEDCIDAHCLIEQVLCHEDYSMECCDFEVSREQVRELTRLVSAVMAAWVGKHDIRPSFGVVDPDAVRKITVE